MLIFMHLILSAHVGLSNDCVEEHKHMHIDYYGGCQELPKCEAEVLADFPRRMKEWLYTIMT